MYNLVLTSAGLDGLKLKSNGNKQIMIDCLSFSFAPLNQVSSDDHETTPKEDS